MSSANQEMERLWGEFAEQLGGFLRSRIADASVVEDLRQDVFLKLQERIRAGDSIRDFRAWLYRIARNAIIDHYRARKSMVEMDETSLIEELPKSPEMEPLMASFRRMIHTLPDGYREAVLLAEIEQLPHKEVAERLGLSLPAVKSRILRGRQMLRESLDRCCQFERDRRGSVIDCSPRMKGSCVECE